MDGTPLALFLLPGNPAGLTWRHRMHYYIKPTGGEWDCGVLLPLPFPKQGKDNRGFASYERMVRFAEKHKLSGPHLVQIRENGVTTMSIEVDLPLTHCSLFKRL